LLLLLIVPVGGCSLGIGGGLAPTVSYTVPANGTGNVPVTAKITATFSSPMDSTTITPSTFTLSQNGILIPGSVNCSGNTATFTPTNHLPGESVFTATITTGAKSAAGIAVATNQAWTFMTIPAQAAGDIVLYYTYTMNGGSFTRSPIPATITNGTNIVSQTFNPTDGSVTLTIQNAPAGYEDNGFYFYVGALQYFTSLRVVAANGSGTYSANLYLDANNDGQFFSWSSNVFAGVGGDMYLSANTSPVNGVLTIDSTTSFNVQGSPGGTYTLPQLVGGALATYGVSGSTGAAIWIGFALSSSGSQTTTIDSITEN
jgi:hypothetical protein